jgi:Domain of unknown function (DUF389)
MHEVRISLPSAYIGAAVSVAHAVGIERVNVSDVFIHGPNLAAKVLSVETSTPKARAFIEKFLTSNAFVGVQSTLTSRELRAIVSDSSPSDLTNPMSEPFPDIIQDLSQLSTLTASYFARAAAGALLMASGMIHNDPIAIVVAALFLPFLSQVLAISFGLWNRDWGLARKGLRTVCLSTVIAVSAGALVATLEGGPIGYNSFKTPLASFAISAAIGVTAGLACADDAGRRYLIGVAAAVQFAVFPVWFGLAAVLGMPSRQIVLDRLLSFGINLTTISVFAALAYAFLHLRNRGGVAPRRSRA